MAFSLSAKAPRVAAPRRAAAAVAAPPRGSRAVAARYKVMVRGPDGAEQSFE